MSLTFNHPFTCILAGPTQSGKSSWTKKFINDLHIIVHPKIEEVIYCLPGGQPFVNSFPKYVKIHEGVPDIENFTDCKKRLIVLDDLMSSAKQNVVDLFTKGSHHFNISVIFIMQNLFSQKPGQRDISLNAHFIVLLKNPREKNQCNYLARQVYPENPRFIQEAFMDATNKEFGYLLFDLTQQTDDLYRFRTNIFSTDFPRNIIYVPKNVNINGVI
jgi:hypothetical protein